VYTNEAYLLDILVEAGYLDSQRLQHVQASLAYGQSAIAALLQSGELDQASIAQVLAGQSGMSYIELDNVEVSSEVLAMMPLSVSQRYKAVPVQFDGFSLYVAISDPLNFEVLDSLPHQLERDVQFYVATPQDIEHFLATRYAENITNTTKDDFAIVDEDGDAPIIRLVQQMLIEAYRNKASDIHIEPMENRLRIRYRMDGKMVEVATHPKKLLGPIIARLKVMSSTMSIAEKRLPQDGRIQVDMGLGRVIDLRVSSVPSNHGESIVMRILDKSALVLGLPELGFFSDDQQTFENLIQLPDGIILVTGPTGSGKTTTLYACLNHVNRPDRKIITVEDPVEYEMSGINQVMVKADIGMTFANALRAILRQAPNIIMIGEIRDAETASIAINASLTGHLVLSTLHTNDAPSAVARLADIGVKRFLIASAVRAVMAQRLTRKLCPQCKAPMPLSDKQSRMLRIDPRLLQAASVCGPVGCDNCKQRGYKGRMGLFEMFTIDDEVRHMINENLTTPQLRKRARELGMRTLREDGVRKILSGLTSAEEVLNVTMADAE